MADDQIDVKITASPEGFSTGMETAKQSLANGLNQMKQGLSGIGTQISASMQQAQNATKSAMDGLGSSVSGAMSQVTSSMSGMKNAIGAAGIAIVGIFGSSTKAALDYEKSLLGLSRTTGMSIASASELAFAASQVGLNSESLTTNIGFLSRNLATLQKDADNSGNVFNRFGIDVHDADGKLLPTGDVLGKIADKFKSMPDGMTKTSLAMNLFGRSGREMITFLNQGSEGLQKAGEKAKQLGLVFNDVSALKAYVAAQRQWDATLKSLQIQIGNSVLPVLTAFAKAITSALQAFNQINPAIRQTIITVTSIGAALAALTLGWGAAAAAITAFGGPFASVGTAMTNMPNVIGACTGGLKSFVVGLADGTMNLVKYIASGQMFSAIHGTMTTAVSGAKAALAGIRTTVVAVSLAYQVGGVQSIASYMASLVSMRSIIAVARMALIALYATVTAGIAVVVALALAWTGNFGGIQEATAGTCDGIIYGLNNFADGVSQIASGIGQIFTALAKTIGNALVGDFSGAIDSAKGLLEGVKNVGAGAWGAMKGLGQSIYGAASDPSGAMNFAKAAGGALWNGAKNIMGLGGGDPGGAGGDPGGGDGSDGAGGDGGKDGGSGADKGESEYEQQKKLYEQQIQLAEYTADEKEALYKTYLENVEKSDKEAMDYKVGLYQLDKEALQEHLHSQELDLENSHTQGKVSEKQYNQELAQLKRANLDAEVEFRAKAAMEAAKLTDEEKQSELQAYKEKVQASTWYKESLKDVLDAKKKLDDYELSVNNKITEYQNQQVLDSIALEEKRQEGLYDIGLITQEKLLAIQRNMEDQRYDIQRKAAEKGISDNAIDLDKMIAAYQKYADARTKADQDVYLQEMLLNSKNEETTLASLKALQDLYSQHSDKLLDIMQKEKTKQLQIITSVKNTLVDDMSSALQDVVKKAKTPLAALQSLFSATMSNILKQITNQLSSNIVQKAFSKFLSKDSKPDTAAIAAEQATQAARNAAAQAGAAQRYIIEQNGDHLELVAVQNKAAMQEGIEAAKNATIVASDQAAAASGVSAIQASITSMLEMLPTLLILSAITGLFGGGGSSTTESTGPGIDLGRSPDSYYKTPTLTGIPSFDVGSWSIPQDTLARVHKDELIVPAKNGSADNVRNMLTGGAKSGSGMQVNLTYSAVHTGRTNADVKAEMKENAKYMVQVLESEHRKFNRGGKK